MAWDKIKSGAEAEASVRNEGSPGASPEPAVKEEVAAEMADLGFSATGTIVAPEPGASGARPEGDGAPHDVVAREAERRGDEVPVVSRASSSDTESPPMVFERKRRKVSSPDDLAVDSLDTPRGGDGGDVETVATDAPVSVMGTPGVVVEVVRGSVVLRETATVARGTEVVREIEREVVLVESGSTVEELLGVCETSGVVGQMVREELAGHVATLSGESLVGGRVGGRDPSRDAGPSRPLDIAREDFVEFATDADLQRIVKDEPRMAPVIREYRREREALAREMEREVEVERGPRRMAVEDAVEAGRRRLPLTRRLMLRCRTGLFLRGQTGTFLCGWSTTSP